jgi:hypothetical protein
VLGTAASVLERVDTPLDAVEQNVSTGEVRIDAPATDKLDLAANLIILGVDIEKADFLEACTGGVLGDRADIDDAKTAAIVGLVGETIDDVLVVVDRADGRLVGTGVLGGGEALDVKDVGGGVAIGSLAGAVHLVELVVEEEVLLFLVDQPALVGVGGADVGG